MRKIVFIVLICITGNVIGQVKKPENIPYFDYKPLHFGISVSLNLMDFTITPVNDFLALDTIESVEVERFPGFNVNIISSYRLGDDWELRFTPGFDFMGKRDLVYTVKEGDPKTIRVESTFAEFPLLIKYRAKRLNNHRPYIITGVNYRLDMDTKEYHVNKEDRVRRLKRSDIYWEIGTGVDIYFPYFKQSTEIKFSLGFNDVLLRDNTQFTNSIDKLTSKMVVLTFNFE